MIKAATAVSVAFLLAGTMSGVASAKPVVSTDPYIIVQSCDTEDLTPEADACVGQIEDPNNDYQNVDYQDPDTDKGLAVNEMYYQLSDGTTTDPTVIEGLFGYTDWLILDKNENTDGSGTGGTYDLTADIGSVDGDWSVASGSLAGFADLLVVLKAGDGWVAYLYSDTSISGGSFDLTWTQNSLSHISIYARGISDDLPEPAVIGFLSFGLIGVGIAARRRKRIA